MNCTPQTGGAPAKNVGDAGGPAWPDLPGVIAAIDQELLASTSVVRSGKTPRASLSARDSKHLIVAFGASRIAVPTRNLVEVYRVPKITRIPRMPPWLLGVANVRGNIVSVIRLPLLLQIDTDVDTPPTRLVVIRSLAAELTTGFPVDRITGFKQLAGSDTKPDESPKQDAEKQVVEKQVVEKQRVEFVRTVLDCDGQPIVALDVELLLSSPEFCCFESPRRNLATARIMS